MARQVLISSFSFSMKKDSGGILGRSSLNYFVELFHHNY